MEASFTLRKVEGKWNFAFFSGEIRRRCAFQGREVAENRRLLLRSLPYIGRKCFSEVLFVEERVTQFVEGKHCAKVDLGGGSGLCISSIAQYMFTFIGCGKKDVSMCTIDDRG